MAAAANAGTNTELGRVLHVLGFPNNILRYVRDVEGLTTLQEVNQIHKDLISTVFENMSKADPAIPYTTMLLSRFKTLHSYLRRMANARTPINPVNITLELLLLELDYAEESKAKEGDKRIPFPTEEFRKDSDWLTFKDGFKNFLDSVPSSRRLTPLSYVIRPTVVPAGADLTETYWTVPVDGTSFKEDNNLVFTYLEKLTRAGIGKTIVANYKATRNGRRAFLDLDEQYTGGAYKTLLITKAWNTLHTTKFQGLTNYTWASYKSDIDEAFRQLLEAGCTTMDDPTKVHHLLNGIQVDYLDDAINHVRQNIMNNYHNASTYLSGAVLTKMSRIGSRNKPQQQRGVSQLSTRNYSTDEWNALTEEEKAEIRKLRDQSNENDRSGRGRQGSFNRGRGSGRSGGRTGQRNNFSGRFGRSLGRGGGRGHSSPGGRGQGENGGRGASQGRGLRQIRQVAAEEVYEEEENYEEQDWSYDANTATDPDQVLEPTPIRRSTKQVRFGDSKYRRVAVFSVRRIGSVMSDESGRCELDSHADNVMLGRDAKILEMYEGQKFAVYGYKKDSAIERYLCKACLAYDDPICGKSFLLVFDQCFVDPDLPSSLLCPNQLRANGLTVDDVPKRYSKESSHSIKVGNLTIPLSCKGYVSYFNARSPSDDELDQLEQVLMTDTEWDPHSEDHENQEKVAMTYSSIGTASTYAVDPSHLAKLWCTTKETAEATLRSTTILASKVFNEPRFSTYSHRFRYLTRRHLKGRFWTDTFFTIKSASGFTCAQLFINELRYLHVVAMRARGEAPYALRHFFDNVGRPDLLICDNAWEQSSEAWRQVLREFGVLERKTEPYRHHQNYGENGIKLIKFRAAKLIERKNIPSIFWDHVLEYTANLSNRMIHKSPRLEGRTPYEWVHGITPDISAFITFSLYDYVFYTLAPKQLFPNPKRKIGRWLGPSKSTVCDLVFKILTVSGHVIHTSAVEPLSQSELDIESYQDMIKEFDQSLKANLEKEYDYTTVTDENNGSVFDILEGETSPGLLETSTESTVQVVQVVRLHGDRMVGTIEQERQLEPSAIDVDIASAESGRASGIPRKARDADIASSESGIASITSSRGWESARITIPRGDGSRHGTVKRRKTGHDGMVVGQGNSNPILDTTIYEVEFDDGMLEELTANVIAQSIYENTDDEGWGESLILDEILDHFVSRKKTKNKSTDGWFLLVRWKSGQETVCRLSELKESYPVQIAEYARRNDLYGEEAFWWVNYVLKKSARVMAKIRTRNVRLEKFGIRVPRTVEEALRFDKVSGTTYWQEAIEKEMRNVMVAFEFLGDGERPGVGYQFIKCHLIFDVKVDGTRKARFVAGGHMTETPSAITYSSVVSRDSIRILLVVAALNGLEVSSTDIQNAYISAKPREKVYFRAGKEFGKDEGRLVIVVRALYGLKSSGAAFRSKLSSELREMGYIPCLADPDVYMKARSKPDGSSFYEYILCYVDDILYIGLDPTTFMEKLKTVFTLKNGYGVPKTFLGAEFQQFAIDDHGQTYQFWGLGMNAYIGRVIGEIEKRAKDFDLVIPTRAVAPMRSGYHPELDFTDYLDDDGVNFYQGLIGTLRWMVEVGRIDIAHAVSVLSSYMSMPRIGHLVEVLHVFAYLKLKPDLSLVLDARDPILKRDLSLTADKSWVDFYPDAIEPIPSNMPEPRGQAVLTHTFVDADWGGNLANRRSHTGMVLFLQSAPIIWVSKRQKTVETSTYGAELCASKLAVELIDGIRYKLRMLGIPIQGSTIVYCDNESVVHNLNNPDSTLKKKHNAIAFHRTRESVAAKTIEVHRVKSELNTSDLLTKVLSGTKTEFHTANLLFDNA